MTTNKPSFKNLSELADYLESMALEIRKSIKNSANAEAWRMPGQWIITLKESPPYSLSDAINGRSYKTKSAAHSVLGNPGLCGKVVQLTE